MHYRELRLAGAYGCSSEDNRRALALLARPDTPARKLITHRLPLGRTTLGLELMEKRLALKVVINPRANNQGA